MSSAALELGASLPNLALLPDGFDPALDAMVVVGRGAAPRLRQLRAAGAPRLVVFDPSAEPLPEGLGRSATTPKKTIDLLLELDPPPRHVTVEVLHSGGVPLAQAEELARMLSTSAMNRATAGTSGAIWVRHAFANLTELGRRSSIAALSGCFDGVPAALVSPGPSLAKNVDALRRNAHKLLIIAGNRALKPLREAGIIPDIVVVADALNLRYQLDGGLLDGVGALCLDIVAHPEVAQLPFEQKFFYSTLAEIHRTTTAGLSGNAELRSGGSVATIGLSLATRLGSNPILLVGQDLALSGSNYYIPTAPDGETIIELEGNVGTFQNTGQALRQAMDEAGTTRLGQNSIQEFLEVPGYFGGQVKTSRQFDTYRTWFGNEARLLSPERRLINATEGGAYIDNFEHIPLEQFVQELPTLEESPKARLAHIASHLPRKQTKSNLERHIQALLRALGTVHDELAKCERLVRQAATSSEDLERLDKAEKKLLAEVKALPFIVALESQEVEDARRAGANARSLEDSLLATQRLYNVIRRAIDFSRPALTQAQRSLKK